MSMTRILILLALPLAIACGDKDDGDTGGSDTTGEDGDEGGDGDGGGGSADGEALFGTSCAGCHGASGEGASGPALPSVVPGLSASAIEDIIQNGVGGMPAITLTADETTAVADYVVTTFGS